MGEPNPILLSFNDAKQVVKAEKSHHGLNVMAGIKVAKQGGLLLSTGAKLSCANHEKHYYVLYGYAHDGSDVYPYRKLLGILED